MELLESEFWDQFSLVIFDLDNTLYDESVYLFAAYQTIADHVTRKTGDDSEIYKNFLIQTFKEHGRDRLFDKFLTYFNLMDRICVNELLTILRDQKIPLHTYNKMKILLSYLLEQRKKIYILTNGNIIQQQNKINNLDISDLLTNVKIIYASMYIPKPSPFCVNMIKKMENVDDRSIILIGDSEIDEMTARNSGINFINCMKISNNGAR